MAWTLKFKSFGDRTTQAPHLRICVGKWKACRQQHWTAGPKNEQVFKRKPHMDLESLHKLVNAEQKFESGNQERSYDGSDDSEEEAYI